MVTLDSNLTMIKKRTETGIVDKFFMYVVLQETTTVSPVQNRVEEGRVVLDFGTVLEGLVV